MFTIRSSRAGVAALPFAVSLLISPIAGQTVPDGDLVDFEDGAQPLLLVTLDGTPPAASLAITRDPARVHDGEAALEFRYQRLSGSPPVLLHPALLTDLVGLRHWILSEKDATWLVVHEDRDGAGFLAVVDLPAGQWVQVDLSPKDFRNDPGSNVHKPAMQPERNGFSWAAVDLAAIHGPPGPNRIWIDTVEVERSDMQHVPGPVVLTGPMTMAVHQPTWIDGDLIVAAGARFESDASRLVVDGEVVVANPGSDARVVDGTLRFGQDYRYEHQAIALDGALLRLADLLVHPGNGMAGLTVVNGARCEIERCSFPSGSFTAMAARQGRIVLRDSDHPGEFLVDRGGELVARDLKGLLVWLVADEHLRAKLDDVHPGPLSSWTLDPAWKRSVNLAAIDQALFGLIVEHGTELTVHKSDLRAVGVYFDRGVAELADYWNGEHFAAQAFDWPGRSVRFQDVSVESWNFYAAGNARITVRDSLFGELLTFDDGVAFVRDSVCDGSGGYLGARGASYLDLERSDVLCAITCDGTSLLRMAAGTVTDTVTAAGDATISFHGCDLLGPLVELENGRIFVR